MRIALCQDRRHENLQTPSSFMFTFRNIISTRIHIYYHVIESRRVMHLTSRLDHDTIII